jgi:Tol biopolymer transport system component
VNPVWSPDSKQVLFIDKPTGDAAAGFYAVDVTAGIATAPEPVGRVGLYSPDRTLAAFAEGSATVVERLSTGESWRVPNNGQYVEFAPDDRHLAWAAEAISGPYDQRQSDIFIANIDGTAVARAARVFGGDLVGWLPKGFSLVFLGRPALDTHERTLTVLDVGANVAVDLVTAERISGVSLSKAGTWAAYFISFNDDAERNGIWVQRTDGSDARRLDPWGAYQWRDDTHLLLIPMRSAPDRPFEVFEIDAQTGAQRQLTDAAVTPLLISNGDWRVAPDGRSIVFVNSTDHNLWLLTLPD